MTKTEEFQQYAAEAMRWARQSKTEEQRLVYLEIARTWFRAAAMRAVSHIEQAPAAILTHVQPWTPPPKQASGSAT